MGKSLFKANFTKKDWQKWIARYQERAFENFIALLEDTGQEFIRDARLNGNYDDWTGNLRSSIGYIIVHDGVPIRLSDFKPEQGKPFRTVEFTTKDNITVKFKAQIRQYDGSAGQNKGRDFANELASEYPKGLILIMCAGMEYAGAVEANGKDVITGATIRAKAYLEKRMKAALK